MKTVAKAASLLLATALGVALVGCSSASEPASTSPDAAAASLAQPVSQGSGTAVEDPAAAGDGGADDKCAATPGNRIVFPVGAEGAVFADLKHELIDLGQSDYAAGKTVLDEAGAILSYTVAPGDSPIAIGDRFCIDYITVLQYNRTGYTIDPDEVLSLSPDPTVQWGDSTKPAEDAS